MLRVRYVPRVISVTCLTSDSSLIQWSVSSTQFIWCVYVCVHVCVSLCMMCMLMCVYMHVSACMCALSI